MESYRSETAKLLPTIELAVLPEAVKVALRAFLGHGEDPRPCDFRDLHTFLPGITRPQKFLTVLIWAFIDPAARDYVMPEFYGAPTDPAAPCTADTPQNG